jgi:hypothetical protein
MDGELGSSRYGPQGGREGGGDGGGYRGGGNDGGGHRGRGRGYNRRGRGGGGRHHNNRRQHPYNNNNNNSNRRRGGGGGGPRAPGNRFSSNTTTSVDPALAMQRQLAAMVSRVGELKEPPDYTALPDDENAPPPMRAVMQAISKNIQDLATVLCGEANAGLFLKFEKAQEQEPLSIKAESDTMADETPSVVQAATIAPAAAAGPLAALLVNCAATLPLQTPAYVGLTVQVHRQAPADFAGFGNRCIDYVLHIVAEHVDRLLSPQSDDDSKRCASEVLHLLRYIALLGKAGLIVGYDADEDELLDPASSTTTTTTVFGLLVTLTKASVKATASASNAHAGILLRHLILSTIPYVLDYIPRMAVSTHIMAYFEDVDTTPYASAYAPGVGSQALLLKSEQKEEGLQDDDDDEEEDDDDDDEDGAPAQVCDTLQDLMRCVKNMVMDEQKTRFALLTDAPWEATSTAEPLRLVALAHSSKSIGDILNDSQAGKHYLHGWEGVVVFGRLPIFGSPAEEDDDDNDDDDEMEQGGEGATTNENLQAYEKGFTLLDRYFLADAVRNCLICHQSMVTDSGVTRGTAKDAAQQIWSICHVLTPSEATESKGVEYIIIETLLSMILQSSDAHLLLSQLYISRVLLELVRAQPAVMPQALAVGVSNLFQFYLPSLVPSARDNFSRWFAFHLTNTDYQWPKAYWDHWATYVGKPTRNSRSDFCLYSLELMSENLSSMGSMVSTCLPPGSTLVNHFFSQDSDDTVVSEIEKEIRERIWDKNEDPDLLQVYIVDGLADAEKDCIWWRTGMIVRPFLQLVEKLQEQQKKQLMDAATANQEDSMDAASSSEDQGNDQDVLAVTTDTIVRYQSVLQAALEKDLQSHIEDLDQKGEPSVTADGLMIGGVAHILDTMSKVTGGNRIMLEGCLKCLLDHDIVETKHVLTWLLGEDRDKSEAVLHWWNLSTIAFRVGLNKVGERVAGEVGIVVDRGDSEDAGGEDVEITRQITAIREFSSASIKNTVLLVFQKLGHGADPKKLTPVEVDLIEGVKRFVIAARLLVRDTLTSIGDKAIKMDRAMELVLSTYFGLSGRALATACSVDGASSTGIDMLVASLEAL